jgi:hypothetical protein
MSQSEIYTLAKSVGLNDSRAKVAAAVAMAESSGNPNAHNAVPPDDSYGLWQINMLGRMGPERRRQFKLSANSDLYNPAANARAMKSISSNGGNFSPWSTYTNGAYRKFLDNAVTDDLGYLDSIAQWTKNLLGQGKDAVSSVPGAAEAAAVATGVNTLGSVVGKSAVWVSNSENWLRVAYVGGGAAIVIAGLVMIVQSTKAGRTVTKTATNVVTKGKL